MAPNPGYGQPQQDAQQQNPYQQNPYQQAGAQQAGLDGVGRAGGRQARPGARERLLDGPVAPPAVRLVGRRDVHGVGPEVARQPGDGLDGGAAQHQEPAVHAAVERRQAAQQVGAARLPGGVPQPVVEHEHADHVAAGARGEQRGVVREAQVAAEPVDGGHLATLAARSASETSATWRARRLGGVIGGAP